MKQNNNIENERRFFRPANSFSMPSRQDLLFPHLDGALGLNKDLLQHAHRMQSNFLCLPQMWVKIIMLRLETHLEGFRDAAGRSTRSFPRLIYGRKKSRTFGGERLSWSAKSDLKTIIWSRERVAHDKDRVGCWKSLPSKAIITRKHPSRHCVGQFHFNRWQFQTCRQLKVILSVGRWWKAALSMEREISNFMQIVFTLIQIPSGGERKKVIVLTNRHVDQLICPLPPSCGLGFDSSRDSSAKTLQVKLKLKRQSETYRKLISLHVSLLHWRSALDNGSQFVIGELHHCRSNRSFVGCLIQMTRRVCGFIIIGVRN